MKKYISLAMVLVLVVSVVLCFSACKDKTDGENESTEGSQQVNYGYSAEVTETSLKIYKDDVFVQELAYPSDKMADFVLAFAKSHVVFSDMNFDGYEDICLTMSTREVGFNYCCWIFDLSKSEFVYNETLSSFTSITVDSTAKQIVSTEKNDSGETVYVVYEWVNGELKKLDSVNELPDTATNSVLGSASSNQTTSRNPENNGTTNNTQSNTEVVTENQDNVQIETKPEGSGSGIVLSPDQYGEVWY